MAANKKTKWRRDETLVAWMFLLPNLIGLLCISLIPILVSLGLSFTDWRLLKSPNFVGLSNFVELFTRDDHFGLVLYNTVYYMIGTVPIGIALAILLACLLNMKIKLRSVFRVLVFIPVVCSTVSAAVLWKWLYAKDYGLIAYYARKLLGIAVPNFLNDPKWAMFAVVVFSIWKSLGYNVVLFLAGLQGIAPTYYEAARIDGASSVQSFFHITLPLLTPSIFFVLISSIISSFQVFDQTFVLTQGGPAYATSTIAYYIYQHGFLWYRMGYASTMAWILFALIMVITIIQWIGQKRWVNYDE